MASDKLSILDVGCGPKILPKEQFAYDVLVRLDADKDNNPDYVHDITKPLPKELLNKFDLVWMSHVLEHIDRNKVHDVTKNVSKALKNGGELWILVPSLEWSMTQFDRVKGTNTAFHLMMYGGQQNEYDYHKAAFTLMDLRFIMEKVGLVTRRAYQTPFLIEHEDGKSIEAIQNVIIGMRHVDDPAILLP